MATMNPMIESFGNLGAGLGQGLAGFAQAQEMQRRRLQQEAQQRLEMLQKVGSIANQNNDGAMMAGLANQMPGLLKQGYGIDVPNNPIVGAPILEPMGKMVPSWRKSEKDARPGLMFRPPQMDEAPPVRTEMHDTGRRDFNNPQTMAAARKGLMLAAPKPEYDFKAVSQFDDWYRIGADGRPVLVRAGKDKPASINPVQDPVSGRWFVPQPGAVSNVKPQPPEKPRYDIDPVDGTVKPVVPGTRFGIKPPTSTPEGRAQVAELAKRTQAAAIVSRLITRKFGGTAKVMPGTAEIVLGEVYPMTQKHQRQLEFAASDLGGRLEMVPGQPPRIILNEGSTASSVADNLKNPRLAWARDIDGTETRVEDRPGVTRAPAPPKPQAPKAPPRWTPEMDNGARKMARQMIADENGGIIPPGPDAQRDIEDAYKLLKAQQMRDNGIQGEKSALERLIELDEQKKKGRKK